MRRKSHKRLVAAEESDATPGICKHRYPLCEGVRAREREEQVVPS